MLHVLEHSTLQKANDLTGSPTAINLFFEANERNGRSFSNSREKPIAIFRVVDRKS
jgi:hypothetical protein